jgi:methylmalonyl-CoA mutase, C-terminal domain
VREEILVSAPIRVLIAKPGLDGHDRGALVVAQGLRDYGMEVIYSGLRQTPAQIVTTAIEEDVACIGLSSLSGAHMELFPEVVRLLLENNAEDILVVGGGVIPDEDISFLKEQGIAEVFTPGSPISQMAEYIRDHVHLKEASDWDGLAALTSRIDHVGIAVANLKESVAFYTNVLGLAVENEEIIEDQKVKTVFLPVGDTLIELLEPTSPDSPIAGFLAKRGPGIHHIAYAVDDVAVALERSRRAGLRLIDEAPRAGGHGKRIGFVHPKDTNGVLTEFCERMSGKADSLK